MDTPTSQAPDASAGDPHGEYASARRGAASFDLSGWTQLELTGDDRAKFLHNFCTNDIRGLSNGKGCEAFITNVQGKVLAHIFAYARAEAIEIICVPECAERITNHLSRYLISEDVTIADRTAERGLLMVAGPQAAVALFNFGAGGLTLANGQNCDCSIGSFRLSVCRNDILGLRGFLLVCPAADTARLRECLDHAGAAKAGGAVFDALRLEAGFPIYGIDITDANLAQEVGRTAQAISFTKGCYLGQEPIARIDALGHVNQQLRGIRLREGPIPPPGAELWTAGADARKIGQITSGALSYDADLPVALGYVKRHFESPGQEVDVLVDGRKTHGEIFWPS